MLRIRDVYPGSWIRMFPSRIRIRIKQFKYGIFNLKKLCLSPRKYRMISDVHPRSGSRGHEALDSGSATLQFYCTPCRESSVATNRNAPQGSVFCDSYYAPPPLPYINRTEKIWSATSVSSVMCNGCPPVIFSMAGEDSSKSATSPPFTCVRAKQVKI